MHLSSPLLSALPCKAIKSQWIAWQANQVSFLPGIKSRSCQWIAWQTIQFSFLTGLLITSLIICLSSRQSWRTFKQESKNQECPLRQSEWVIIKIKCKMWSNGYSVAQCNCYNSFSSWESALPQNNCAWVHSDVGPNIRLFSIWLLHQENNWCTP